MALAVALGAATVTSGIGLMATSAWLISTAALHPSIADLGLAIVAVRAFGIGRGVGRYLERYVSHSVTFRLLSRLRAWFYRALEPLAPARLMDFHSGDILSRAIADIESLHDFYVRAIAPPLVAVIVIGLMGLWLGWLAPALAAALLLFLALAGLGIPVLVQQLSRRPSEAALADRAELSGLLVDGIQGMPDILAFGAAEELRRKVAEAGGRLIDDQRRLARIDAMQNGLSELAANGGMWAVLVVAIGLLGSGQIAGTTLAAAVLGALAAFEAVRPLPLAAQAWQRGRAAAQRLFDLVDAPPAVQEPASPVSAPARPALSVHSLTFRYSPETPPALDGISFSAEPGERIAVVGPSGAGKSTLANLLLRFWDCRPGQIRLDGVDLNSIASDDLRSRIGFISQRTYLFSETIRQNLLMARTNATRNELWEAIERAQLSEFVRHLPQGLDTWIGEHGRNLSGGERQRLAIARMLLRDASLLVLDEPTADLDPVTERAVLRSVLAVFAGKTLLLITHRLVGLEAMDGILVMDRGRIVDRGRHADLVRRAGLYRRLWTLQNRALIQPA